MNFDFNLLRNKIKNLKLKYYGDSQRKLDVLLKLDVYLRNHYKTLSLSKIPYSVLKVEEDQQTGQVYDNFATLLQQFEEDLKACYESDLIQNKIGHDTSYMKIPSFSKHCPDNIVLFRNFIDGFIRAVYMCNKRNFENIEKVIETTILYRVRPLFYYLSSQKAKQLKKQSLNNLDTLRDVQQGPTIEYSYGASVDHTIANQTNNQSIASVA